MIQGVKLGTHRIGTYMDATVSVRSCSAFVWKISSKNLKKIINNVGVERGVATRRAQMVWPMMTVTVTGSNFEKFAKNVNENDPNSKIAA